MYDVKINQKQLNSVINIVIRCMWFWLVMVIRDLHKVLIVIWKVMILIFLQDEKDAGMKEKRRDTEEDAQRLVEFGQENTYLREAFYHVLAKRLLRQGYVDGSYILNAVTRGNYYSQLKDSKIRGLFATKSCVPSENIDVMIQYLENIAGNAAAMNELEEEALLFWIFLPYLAASKREQRQTYLLQILQKLLQIYSEDEKKKWNLAVSNGVTEPVSFRKLTMWQNISEKSINHNKQDPAGTPPAIRANLLHAGLSKGE